MNKSGLFFEMHDVYVIATALRYLIGEIEAGRAAFFSGRGMDTTGFVDVNASKVLEEIESNRTFKRYEKYGHE